MACAALVVMGMWSASALADTVSYAQVTSTNASSKGNYPAMSFLLGDRQVRVTRQTAATPDTAQLALRTFTLYDAGGTGATTPVFLSIRDSVTGTEIARSVNSLSMTGGDKGRPLNFEFGASAPAMLDRNTPYRVAFVNAAGADVMGRSEANNTASPDSQFLSRDGRVLEPAYSPRFTVSGDAVVFQRDVARFSRVGPTDFASKGTYSGFTLALDDGTAVSPAKASVQGAQKLALRQIVLFDAGSLSLPGPVYLSLRRAGSTVEIARSSNAVTMTGGAKGRRLVFDFSSQLPELERSAPYTAVFVTPNGQRVNGRFEVNHTAASAQSRLLTLDDALISPGHSPRFELIADALPTASAAATITAKVPSYYYVLVLAGQSNMVGYGEELADPDGLDAPDARIVQVGRAAGRDHTVVPATFNLDHVQDMAGSSLKNGVSHTLVRNGQRDWARYGGTVGAGLSLAKKLLPYIPADAGILLVPAARGSAAFTTGSDSAYTPGLTRVYVDGSRGGTSTGTWTRWGVSGGHAANEGGKTGLYLDMLERTRWALQQNPRNVLVGVAWMQGESDLGNPSGHKAAFEAQLKTFGSDLNRTSRAQCLDSDCSRTPWIAGDTSISWKRPGYDTVYLQTYGRSALPQVSFVPFMYQADGVTPTSTNQDYAYNAQSNPTGADRRSSAAPTTHFGTRALREVVGPLMGVGVIEAANRAAVRQP
ncbi:sialate O-acetylesterase [Amphibiibacter pelophylacis]|uniref:Sialate O-acetylesterase n=1 Tax=Amphibiibacter pelophylacis TaxID=1799477 RepID=A0ACC6P2J7_9BURK